MASDAETQELSALFERLLARHRDLSSFIPFILGFANAADTTVTQENSNTYNNEPNPNQNQRDRIILINPFTQGMVVIEGGAASSLESMMREMVNKSGLPPASKSSIEAMPSVVAGESEGLQCVICLEEWEVGEELKEMPCKHRFHGKCIEKWLGINGSCPVCRYKMPVEDDEFGKKRDDERRRFGREIWVTFSLNRESGVDSEASSVDSDSSQRLS